MGRLVVVIFGLMGTGKTNRAQALGAARGWPVIHSDQVRKELAGFQPTNRVAVDFGAGIYSEEFSTHTYAQMRRQAQEHLAAGHNVILDASYKRATDRALVRQLAREHGAKAVFVYCTCPLEEVRARLARRLGNAAAISDGRLEIMAQQTEDFDPLAPEDQPRLRLDTSRDPEVVLRELLNFVKSHEQKGEVNAT